MNSRVSSSIEDIDPLVREKAEAAARQAGMSLNDWLNSTLANSPNRRPALPGEEARDVADIHQRLDSITRQIDRISRPGTRGDEPRADRIRGGMPSRGETVRNDPGGARNLNDAISRLDARLSQISSPPPARPTPLQDKQRQAEIVERAAAQVYHAPPATGPASLDVAIAEIAARQDELDKAAQRTPASASPPTAAPAVAAAAGPDFSVLERQLFKITSQIEALRDPGGIEQSIATFRSELSEIRLAITAAMPRRAIESLENEVQSLSRRIDDSRQSMIDGQALAGIERALDEIREVLRSLTPAEQLAGYDEAIRNLGAKLDLILRANDDPSTIHQLEGAIAALRSIVSNVASNDALGRLSDDVRQLSSRVDQLGHFEGHGDSFAALEHRIAALTSALGERERPVASENSAHLESVLRALSDRIDRIPAGDDGASAFAHLEQRVSYLLKRLEASADHRGGNLGRVEDGLQDILRHLETQQASFSALAAHHTPAIAENDIAGIVRRELSDIHFSQSERDRHTQDSLEAVHSTLGHVVDRLTVIEGDLRMVRSAPVAPIAPQRIMPPAAQPATPPTVTPRVAAPPQARPELPNPAAMQGHFTAAPRDFHAAQPMTPAEATTPKTIGEILEPHAAPPRAAIEPDLPPDHPLEPGTRPNGRPALPSERIAASENAINEIAAGAKEPVSTTSFIAAARRAAQAAAVASPAGDKASRAAQKIPAPSKAGDSSTITSKIRALLVGASVVVIVLGSFKVTMALLDSASSPPPAMENAVAPAPAQQPPTAAQQPTVPAPAAPSMTSPTPIGRQSLNGDAPDDTAAMPIPQADAAGSASPAPASDVAAALPVAPTATGKPGPAQIQPTERLPEAIGGPALRAAALKGNPAAAYEIGVRYTDGKGVATNLDEAMKWYGRAAQAGVVPAIFRLGTFYEKGMGVQKDADAARRYYLQAAERGNAKAMHNLAVLDADGGGKGANYKSASEWFRKAAERGVADSQFNLGILYARGIGVEQNLAESYKWFSLAAAQGDADSVRKRDDVAKRLDPQSLAAAKLAIQTFIPEPQPEDAVNVTAPPGGWDNAPAQAAAKAAARPVPVRRAAR